MNQHFGTSQNPRIELQTPAESDMLFIRWLWSDFETMKPVGGPIHLTDEQSQHWFTKMIKPGSPSDCYRLIFNEKNQPVGEISFHHLKPESMKAEFNIKIASTKRGNGYAKKAMLLFLDFFFNQIGGRIMVDDVAVDNHGGQKTLLNFGFEHDSQISHVYRLFLTRERYNSLYGLDVSTQEDPAG